MFQLPDFTSRRWTILFLIVAVVSTFAATVVVYLLPHCPEELRKLCAGALASSSSVLLLALQVSPGSVPSSNSNTSQSKEVP